MKQTKFYEADDKMISSRRCSASLPTPTPPGLLTTAIPSKASIISNLRALGKKKQIYITPECELTAYYAEPLMSISNPATDETFRAEEGLNKTETFGETEEGFWD